MKLDNKTQLFRPLQTPIDNLTSYYLYCWSNHKPWFLIVKALIFAMAIMGLVGDVTDFLSGSLWSRLLIIAGFVLPGILTFVEFAGNYEKRFTQQESVPGAYDNVMPHAEGWTRIDLQIPTGLEPVFRSDAVDAFLRSGKPIPMERDLAYEKNLRRRIQDKNLWEELYHPFLRHNHRTAMYQGKQFYNEKKYGLSQPIDLSFPKAKIHKTCYYDTYLTNIIPGQQLIYNRDQETAADASGADFMPYRTDSNGERHLYYLGEKITANELGVTTILITANDHIRLWTQNRLSQCSSGMLVASGSGSADWNDCKKFIGDPDGLRKSVICGMERELWEESNGTRATERKLFQANVQTRITGYFRWLRKGGKSEFVGVSRLQDWGLIGNLSPEYSEVTGGTDLPAHSISELIQTIDSELSRDHVSQHCGVSCSMALNALRSTCFEYCAKCPHWQAGACTAEKCTARPFQVLFE